MRKGWRLRSATLALTIAACDSETVGFVQPEPLAGPVALDRTTGAQEYHGLPAGLSENGSPVVTPVDGRIVIVAISMSNGFMEMNRFIQLYRGHPQIASAIGLVNCAKGGHALERWLSMPSLWAECDQKIRAAGFRPEQVRVVWAKNANEYPSGRAASPLHAVRLVSALSGAGRLPRRRIMAAGRQSRARRRCSRASGSSSSWR